MMSYLAESSVIEDKPYFLCHIFILALDSHILLAKSEVYHTNVWVAFWQLIDKEFGNGADAISEHHGWLDHVFIFVEGKWTDPTWTIQPSICAELITWESPGKPAVDNHHYKMFHYAESFPGKWKLKNGKGDVSNTKQTRWLNASILEQV